MGGKKKGKKKKKLTEEEKKKIEEERLREEEERRREEEEKERIRKEEERKRKEEEERLREIERKRLEEEQPIYQERAMRLMELEQQSKKEKEVIHDWKKWVDCAYLPEPDNDKDLNTHLRLWNESTDKDIEQCIDNCQISEDIIDKLIQALSLAQSEHNTEKVKKINEFIGIMREEARKKIDKVTHRFMEHIDLYMPNENDSQTNN